jgi:hypothetical protein
MVSDAMFSIHKICRCAIHRGWKIGNSVDNNTMAQIIKDLVEENQKIIEDLFEKTMIVYITGNDRIIHALELGKLMTARGIKVPNLCVIMVLITALFGIDSLNPLYIPQLTQLIGRHQFIGLVNGAPMNKNIFL